MNGATIALKEPCLPESFHGIFVNIAEAIQYLEEHEWTRQADHWIKQDCEGDTMKARVETVESLNIVAGRSFPRTKRTVLDCLYRECDDEESVIAREKARLSQIRQD